jgi:hypothetical protein
MQKRILRRNNCTLAVTHRSEQVFSHGDCFLLFLKVIITTKVPAIPLQEKPKFYSIRVHEGNVCHLNLQYMDIISNSNAVVRAHSETCSSGKTNLMTVTQLRLCDNIQIHEQKSFID